MIQYEFTDELDKDLQTINNIAQLKEILKRKISDKGKSYFKFYHKQNQYIYAYCARCKARIRFNYDRQSLNYRLTFSNLNHRHETHRNFEYQAISSFIKSLPNEIEQAQIKHLVMDHFKIKQSRFYYIYNRCKYPQQTYNQAIKFLQANHCFIQSQPWEEQMDSFPDVLIVVSPAMKELFQQFGQWLYFDTTYHIVRNRTEDGRQWKVGMFIGLNSGRMIIPFGYCLILDETKQNFSKIFRSFFEIMGKAPNAIITDQSAAIKGSIIDLKNARDYVGEHFFDNFHIIRNIKKKLRRKSNIQYFVNLMRANSFEKFQQLRQNYYSEFEEENDLQIFTKFINNSSDYCFACIPSVFIGTSVSDSPIQKANDLLKSKIKIERAFPTVVIEIFKFMEDLIVKSFKKFSIESKMVEQYYCLSQLKYIRFIVCKSIFKALIRQIKQIYLLDLEQDSHDCWRVKDQDQLIFYVRTNQQTKELSCSCKFREKSGLPCSHLCKCIKACRKSILEYIFPRWKRQYVDDKNKFKVGRGKNTRRNRN